MKSVMRFPGNRAKALTLSYDDGVWEDIRLIDIMKAHGLKGTFNINSAHLGKTDAGAHRERLSVEQVKALYRPNGQELAVHAYTHPHLSEMTAPQITYETIRDRAELEALIEEPVRGMAYPMGTFNDTVVDCLAACGIAYSRTTISSGNFNLPTDWLRLPATCHHNDGRLFDLCDAFLAKKHRAIDICQLFYLWGHSYEFNINNNWERIEQFAEKMGGHEEIWYATNIEIYDYIQAYKSLIWSADSRIVYNPTATTVYFNCDAGSRTVEPGQTLILF